MKNTKYFKQTFAGILFLGLLNTVSAQINNGTNTLSGNSSSTGINNTGTGAYSFSSGAYNTTSGAYSNALGYNNIASGSYSFAAVRNAQAAGIYSVALGYQTQAIGHFSSAYGFYSEATGSYSFAYGKYVKASNTDAYVMGAGFSGNKLENNIANSLMIGFNSNIPTVFVGPSSGIGTTGNVGIGSTSPTAKLHVIGNDNAWPVRIEHNSTTDWQVAAEIIVERDNAMPLAIRKDDGQNIEDIFVIRGNGVVNAKSLYAEKIEVRIDAISISWPDYVFAKDYQLRTLSELESYIQANNHLPDVPSAVEVNDTGIDLAKMDAILLQKIEELTLYTIELNKKVEALQMENKELKNIK
jgi:trimeric autotransporter adhesin